MMGVQQILWVLSLFLLIQQSISSPVTLSARESHPLLKDPDNLEKLHERYKGIYFGHAAKTCSYEEFNTLVNTLPGILELMKGKGSQSLYKTPGWNRYFMADRNVPEKERWATAYYLQYLNINNAFEKARSFPEHGRPTDSGVATHGDRITLTCKQLGLRKGKTPRCEENPNVAAFTFQNAMTPFEWASVVTFCPRFFTNQIVNGRVKPTPKTVRKLTFDERWTEQALIQTRSKEHVFVHEIFHCEESMEMSFYIEDISGTVPTVYQTWPSKELETVQMYGPDFAAMYAWKNTYRKNSKQWKLNPDVMYNADSYAWCLTFNWFNDVYNWKSDGGFRFRDEKDELKRDLGPNLGPNSISHWATVHEKQFQANFEHNPETVVQASSINVQQSLSPPKNCHQVGGNPLDVKCEFPATTNTNSHPSSTTQNSAPPAPAVPNAVPAPPHSLHQIIIGFRVAYDQWTMAPSNHWAYWTPDIGMKAHYCDGPKGMWDASSGISLSNVPYPDSHTFGVKVNGWTGCSYTGSADKPGTFLCDGMDAPIQCTNGVENTLHGEGHGCPSPLGDPHKERAKVICQWGNPPVGPPKPSPTSQVIIGFKTWGSSKHGTNTSPNHKYWDAWTPAIGSKPDFCNGPVAEWEAPYDIHINKVPFPTSHLFEGVDINGLSGCSYQGSPHKPGTFSCPGWTQSVPCTNGVHDTRHECPGSLGGWKKYRPKLICQW